jgi:beta-glucanase (GH16 family)
MRLGAAIVTALIIMSLISCEASVPMPLGVPPGPWLLIFSEDFNNASLNTANWSLGWDAQGVTAPVNAEELECYDPKNVTVSGGALLLRLTQHPESCGRRMRNFSSGIINTKGKFEFTYGYMESRIWLPSRANQIVNWPAFWANGNDWPQDGEIDVMEGLSGQACWHFFYSQGNPGNCPSGAFARGWHTFGANWERRFITYYYDGRKVGTVKIGITSSPMYIILNYATDRRYGGAVAAPETMRIDYVRVWQHPR